MYILKNSNELYRKCIFNLRKIKKNNVCISVFYFVYELNFKVYKTNIFEILKV